MATVIDRITQTKKGRYALFCGGDFLFSVDERTFERHHLTTGMSLTDAQLADIRADSDNQKAVRKALDYLALRDHSRQELTTKLRKTFDEHTAVYATDKIEEFGYLDDVRFAQRYAEELIVRKGFSRREAGSRLRQKGVGREIIEETLAHYDEDETEGIAAVIERKYRRKIEEGKTDSVFASLLRKGFSATDIRRALQQYGQKIDEEY